MAYASPNCSKDLRICSSFLQGKCTWKCGCLHLLKDFQWQVEVTAQEWATVDNEDCLESAYCNPAVDIFQLQSTVSQGGSPICEVMLEVDFSHFVCRVMQTCGTVSTTKIRRLSTKSYVEAKLEGPPAGTTVWTWYWNCQQHWKKFEYDSSSPMQSVIESKYLAGQDIFRFEVDSRDASVPVVMLLNFLTMTLQSLAEGTSWHIKRRPEKNAAAHNRKGLPYDIEVPKNWKPVDVQHEFELVPINPDSMEFHLVASEFKQTLKNEIKDIFRIQNIHLWHKFVSKKKYLESRGKETNEQRLFHGTSRDEVVQSIFSQNFDWRCAGKNATRFGKGSYFARDASYSDNYTGGRKCPQANHWIFVALVLLGDYTRGNPDYMRPPPKDPDKPHGELYDSCVNDVTKPTIFVIFDSDQVYPEYAICYGKRDKDEW